MDTVVYRSQQQWANLPFAVRGNTPHHANQSQHQIHNAENQTKPFGSRQTPGETEIQRDYTRNDVNQVMRRIQMGTEQLWCGETRNSYKQENNS